MPGPMGNLFVLASGRKFGPLTREKLGALFSGKRVAGSDLVAALDGPWMRVEDFFAERSAAKPVSADASKNKAPLKSETDSEEIVFIDFDSHDGIVDSWQTRVHATPTSYMTAQNLQQLLEAREITMESAAHHISWAELEWKPIREIPFLRERLKPPPPRKY